MTEQTAARSGARYEILEEIGRGGMGSVHRARDRFTSRTVAYKRMTPGKDAQRARTTALFRREYETLARLPHPNIVQVYDYGLDELGPYYSMELLSGDDLTKVAPMDVQRACRVLRDVASALALVHARRLVHRDVSPNNIRLTADGRAKLLDFGALTPFGRPKELVGTPVCIAPECLAHANLDQRVDIYGLGAVAYWLLTRRTHVYASTVEDLADELERPAEPPSAHVSDIPPALDDLVMALLARDPLARPESAAAVIERLTTIGELPEESDERAVAYSYLARPPLVGRDQTLQRIAASVDHAVAGSADHLLIEAPRGVGRTAVLEDGAFYAQSTGANVIRLRGALEGESFSTVRALVDSLLALYPDLDEGNGRPSRPVLDGEVAKSRVDSAATVAERHAAILAFAESVALAAARRAPLILFVDDLDQLDDLSASLIASLSSASAEYGLTIVASAKTEDVTHASPAVRLYRTHADSLSLEALSAEQITALVRALFGPVLNSTALAKWLHSQSEGRPAVAMDLARILLERGSISYTRGTFALPQDASRELAETPLAQAILSRLGGVGPDARQVAGALALHGRALRLARLASALDLPISRVFLAVEELAQVGAVAALGDQATLASSALGDALVASVGEAERRALHARLAEVLLASADGPECHMAASSHFLKAGLEQRAVDAFAPLAQEQFILGTIMASWVETLEALLDIYKRQGRRIEECLPIMVHLVNSGFYGELAVQTRHIDLTLRWMSLVTGMTLATRLRPYLGAKLALVCGLIYAGFRRGFTPKAARLGTLPQMLDLFARLVSAGVAAATSSLDTLTARQVIAYLEPFAVLPPDSGGYLLREFGLATCDMCTGMTTRALERYERLVPIFKKRVKGLHDDARRQLYLGCLNGIAQGSLWRTSPRGLEAAEELTTDPFFAPHAECARMFYYAYRGERDQADVFRARVELAALHGGTSWSAMVLVAAHFGLVAMRTRDHVALIQSISEQRRLATMAPSLLFTAEFCEAWLEHLRGNSARAANMYEGLLALPEVQGSVGWRMQVAYYTTVLCALGRYEEAKRLCLFAAEGEIDPARVHVLGREVLTPLAFAEQGLGNHESARALLDSIVEDAEREGNPLRAGNAHRDRAQLALAQRDKDAFERHFHQADGHFRATHHPALITQLEGLAKEAERAGLRQRVPSSLRTTPDNDDFDGETTIGFDDAGDDEASAGETIRRAN